MRGRRTGGGAEPTLGDVIRLVLAAGKEMDVRLRPLTAAERAAGPDALAARLWDQVCEQTKEGNMDADRDEGMDEDRPFDCVGILWGDRVQLKRRQTKDATIEALANWLRVLHISTHVDADADAMNVEALCCEDVARAFLEAAGNLRHAAMEAAENAAMSERRRQADFGVILPVGFVRQPDQTVEGCRWEVWQRPDGSVIRLMRPPKGGKMPTAHVERKAVPSKKAPRRAAPKKAGKR